MAHLNHQIGAERLKTLYAPMVFLGTTVTVQRVGSLDLCSLADQIYSGRARFIA
jgi:hypothetical protein